MPSDAARARRALEDIRDHIDKAEAFTTGLDYDAFESDEMRLLAVIRCLEVVSEASRRLPAEVTLRHPDIPWREIAAAGNVYRHAYDTVSTRRIWNTVTLSLPPSGA